MKNTTKLSIFTIFAVNCMLILALSSCGDGTTDKYLTDPIPDGIPAPIEPEDAVIDDAEYTCILSIKIEVEAEKFDKNKRGLIPDGGYLIEPCEVIFYGGESVFNVLRRECRAREIHMEFSETPIYNSAYIEGIGNLYEFDAGSLSGWEYSVNGLSPNYGCSRYGLRDGDVVEWVFVPERTVSQKDE